MGPELATLYESGRVKLTTATDKEALEAAHYFAKHEGVIPALESAHALAHARKLVPTLPADAIVVVTVSGRGDKDIFTLARSIKDKSFKEFLKDEYNRYD